MKTSSAKAKGRRLQKLVVDAILEYYGHLGLTENDVTSAIMGESGMDVRLSEAARRHFPYATECKNVEKVNIWAAIKQAQEHAKGTNLRPLVVLLRNHGEPHVVLSLHDFFDIQTDAQALHRGIEAHKEDEEIMATLKGEPDKSLYEEMMERSHKHLPPTGENS